MEKIQTDKLKTKHGGARPNSGRKGKAPEERRDYQLNLMIQKSLKDKLDNLSQEFNLHKSTIAEIIISEYFLDEYSEITQKILEKTLTKSKIDPTLKE